MPSTLGAAPSIEFVVLLGHAGHNYKFLSAQYPTIGTRICCWQALIRPRHLRARACSYGVRLRFQFFRPFRFLVEMAPVLEQPFSGFYRSIRHGVSSIHDRAFVGSQSRFFGDCGGTGSPAAARNPVSTSLQYSRSVSVVAAASFSSASLTLARKYSRLSAICPPRERKLIVPG